MKIGIIGGSGLYDLEGLEDLHELHVDTPFGAPSDAIMAGKLNDVEVFFLPRHGKGHRILPGELNHRANIYALKVQGVESILSISAVGSFKEELAPGDVVLVDQFVDRTKRSQDHTFFGDGIAAHIPFAHPTCDRLRVHVKQVVASLLAKENPNGVTLHDCGTYLNMEGPAFSTLAESKLYQCWGMDVIGMTNLAEAKLAREAEICYLSIAMVTDYDCWHETHETVSVEMIIKTLMQNADLAKTIVKEAVTQLAADHTDCSCRHALEYAIVTDRAVIPAETKARLEPIAGKYL